MKRIFITGIAVCFIQFSFAQDVFDALRYSYQTSAGSARLQAIGSTNISLGGDISSTFINPAGLGQFKTNEIVFTPAYNFNTLKTDYNDISTRGTKSKITGGTNGVIFSFGNRFRSSNLKNTTLSFAVNQSANYNSRFAYGGRNLNSSYSEKWLEEIVRSGYTDFDNIRSRFPLGASQAYESYLIDINGNTIFTNADIAKNLDQSFSYETKGGMSEVAAAMAWNLNEKFLYGITLGFPIIQFDRKTTVTEKDGTGNMDNDFESFTFTENLGTRGGGFNAKIGMIIKPVEYFRIGLTLHSPSLISLTDYASAEITSNIENYSKKINNDPGKPSTYTYNTGDVNVLSGIEGDENRYSYRLITPWKAGIGLSYVFREISDVTKQKAFITGDFEIVDYKTMSFKSNAGTGNGDDAYFNSVNESIDEMYKMAFNARIGGELKFKTFMVRGGFNFMGSPYVKNFIVDESGKDRKNWRMTPSLGIGYRDKGFFVDLAYLHSFGNSFHVPYTLEDANIPVPLALNKITNGQIIATVGFKF
ncbi:MAG: hypothetical protein KA160_09810 [Lacibacter sp.]|nr:hypothetical protein [Lacibacter sp.]